jgi:hypothetical protein
MVKKLEPESRYNEFDLNHDGTVDDAEIAKSKEMIELELREEKSHAQKQMSWTAIGSMIAFTLLLFLPLVSELADLLGLFYLGQASIVGFYFGATAYMSRSR